MFKVLCLVALLGVASAQRWPMITVNAAGEIVLQSLTRAQSFQITPASVTTAPTSSVTASLTTATALTSGVSAFIVGTALSPATGHGVTLPTPSAGMEITLIQSQTTFASYTIWTSASTVFINSDSSIVSLAITSRRTVCYALSSTRWNCIQDSVDSFANTEYRNILATVSTTGTSTTLTAAQSGGIVYYQSASGAAIAATVTLPSCTALTQGMYFQLVGLVTVTASILTLTIAPGSSDKLVATFVGPTLPTGTLALSTATSVRGNVAAANAATNIVFVSSTGVVGQQFDITLTCVTANQWVGIGGFVFA